MALRWQYDVDGIDWHALYALYQAAPLGDKTAAQLQTAFTNSMFVCFVFDGDTLVGAGRGVADGVDVSYIGDVALLPSHQGRGLGTQMVRWLVERSRGHKKIFLYSVPGKEGFCKALGFRRMTTTMAIFEDEAGAQERGYLDDICRVELDACAVPSHLQKTGL